MNLSSQQILKSIDKKFLIQVAIRYAALVLFLWLFILPSCRRTGSLKIKLGELRTDLALARNKIAQGLSLQNNRGIFLEDIRLTEEKFFTEDELPQLLAMISDLAKSHNLQMTASRPVQTPSWPSPSSVPPPSPQGGVPPAPPAVSAESFYRSQDFDIDLSGGYHALGGFLSALKNFPKLMQVRRLKIMTGKDSVRDHAINLTISVYSKA